VGVVFTRGCRRLLP